MTFIDINKRNNTIENLNALWLQINKPSEWQVENSLN